MPFDTVNDHVASCPFHYQECGVDALDELLAVEWSSGYIPVLLAYSPNDESALVIFKRLED